MLDDSEVTVEGQLGLGGPGEGKVLPASMLDAGGHDRGRASGKLKRPCGLVGGGGFDPMSRAPPYVVRTVLCDGSPVRRFTVVTDSPLEGLIPC